MAMRSVIVAKNRQRSHNRDTLGTHRHQDHALLLVCSSFWVCLAHKDAHLAPRVWGSRSPPLVAVQYIFLSIPVGEDKYVAISDMLAVVGDIEFRAHQSLEL